MSASAWTIVDPAGAPVEDFSVSAGDFRIERRTLRSGLSAGVETLRIDNGRLAFTLLPTRGMGIWKAWLGGEEIGWRSPVRGPVHPQFVPLAEPGGLGWLDGFDELLARCGLESNGAPEFETSGRLKHPLHGRIANRPAHACRVEIDPASGELRVTGVVEETRFLFSKLRLTTTITARPGDQGLVIRDEIENLAATPTTAQMLYHINFGLPLLDAGSKFVAPVKQVVPRNSRAAEGIEQWSEYAPPTPGFEEQVYLCELAGDAAGHTRVLLKNSAGSRGVGLKFNLQQLPCFTLWKNTQAEQDGYVTGLEPGTNYPNPRWFETARQRVLSLAPGGKQTLELRLEAYGAAQEVAAAEEAIAPLAGQAQRLIHREPLADWCS